MRRLNLLFLFHFGLLFITVLNFYTCTNAQVLTISEIINNPDQYHLKPVKVKGEVLDVKHKISRKGNEYTVFVLSDGSAGIKVFTFGSPQINVGDKVKVEGVFYKVKYVGRYTFYNEIDATNGLIKKE
jgi:DNA/RNA endonuclease YhcR with UshA esterase domain